MDEPRWIHRGCYELSNQGEGDGEFNPWSDAQSSSGLVLNGGS